jgi:hypothetical protein
MAERALGENRDELILPTTLRLLASLEQTLAGRADTPWALVMATQGFLNMWLFVSLRSSMMCFAGATDDG